jgi:hypothetical protein
VRGRKYSDQALRILMGVAPNPWCSSRLGANACRVRSCLVWRFILVPLVASHRCPAISSCFSRLAWCCRRF